MRTEMTFRRGVGLGVEIDRVIRACLHARLAADANGRIELNDAIVALIHRADGADAHTWRVGTVITTCHLEAATHIWVRARLDILDPRAIHAERHLVLGLARGRAGVTSDALALVDEKAVICHGYAACGGVTAFMMAVVKSVGVTPGDWIFKR